MAGLGQAVIATDLDGTVGYWNAAAEAMYGWSAEEALGRNIAALTVAEISQEAGAEIMAALREGLPWSGSFLVRSRDGATFPALVTDAGIYRDGELVGIVGISTNLGAAVGPLLDRSSDAAFVLRSDAVITYASPNVSQLFGVCETDLIGTSFVPLVHVSDRAPLADYLGKVGRARGVHPPLELRMRRDDDWVWCEVAFTNLLDDPVIRGLVCNVRASPRRVAFEAVEKERRALQTALESRVIIEQAKGFLIARERIGAQEAFERIRRYARARQLTVRAVAARVIAGHLELHERPRDR